MRTLLKILLVAGALAAVVASMAYFAKTRLEPPSAVNSTNPHAAEVEKSIEKINGNLGETALNRQFFEVKHRIDFLCENNLLSKEDGDKLKTTMMERYVAEYADKAIQRLGNTSWNDQDIDDIASQVKMARNVKTSDGKRVVETLPEYGERFNRVLAVVERYDSAKVLAQGKTYQNWANTKKRMARAKRFMHDKYLSRNQQLVSDLEAFRFRLEEAHYEYLENRVAMLGNYKQIEEADYDNICHGVDEEVSLYADSAAVVYGHDPKSVSQLRSAMVAHKANAKVYYITDAPIRYANDRLNDIIDYGKTIIQDIYE